MNRHERRKRFAAGQKYVRDYVKQLPETDISELGRPGIVHMVYHHDDWCDMLKGGVACTWNPILKFYREPRRS
jgi:hypothetical protein